MDCIINTIGEVLLVFYILKMRDCEMITLKMQTNDLYDNAKKNFDDNISIPKILGFSKTFVLSGIFQTNWHFLILNGHGSHVTLKVIEQTHALDKIWSNSQAIHHTHCNP
jgi:hypothetical protein